MERFRSKSTKDGRRMQQLDNIWPPHPYAAAAGGDQAAAVVETPPRLSELRSYSTSYVSSPYKDLVVVAAQPTKLKKSMTTTNWSLITDPELQRKKRVAGYNAYGIERKMKGSFGKSFKWIKNGCHHVFGGGWW